MITSYNHKEIRFHAHENVQLPSYSLLLHSKNYLLASKDEQNDNFRTAAATEAATVTAAATVIAIVNVTHLVITQYLACASRITICVDRIHNDASERTQ